jgi:hypothetical protein
MRAAVRAADLSLLRQPHDCVSPLRTDCTATTVVRPQSHVNCQRIVFPEFAARSTATSRPYRWPGASLMILLLGRSPA